MRFKLRLKSLNSLEKIFPRINYITKTFYEDEEKFTLEWVSPETVLTVNRTHHHGKKQEHFQFETMSERECRVIEVLMKELEWS